MLPIATGNVTRRSVLILVTEYVLIVACVVLGVVATRATHTLGASVIWRATLIAAVLQVCLHYRDLYDLRTLSQPDKVIVGLLQALGAASLVLAVMYAVFPPLSIGRGVFIIASVAIVGCIVGWRLAFGWLSLRMRPTERLLIVGTGAAAVSLAKELYHRRHALGVEIVGFVDPDPSLVGQRLINPGVIGTVADIPDLVRGHDVDRVVVSLGDARGKLSMDQLLAMKVRDGVRFGHLASLYEEYTGKIAVENLRPSWFIFSEGFRKDRLTAAVKRGVDVVSAIVGLMLAAPIMAIVAIAIRVTSPGPLIYAQRRVGLRNHIFTMHKFRSMRVDAEASTGAIWAQAVDPRVTPVGRVLRRLRLDELPQLWNVLCGDMSLVGPRPERPEFVARLTDEVPFYGQRHAVRPGITGWAQVRHTYAASVEDSLEKLQYDLFYVKHLSVTLDLLIIFETIKTVLVRRGS